MLVHAYKDFMKHRIGFVINVENFVNNANKMIHIALAVMENNLDFWIIKLINVIVK